MDYIDIKALNDALGRFPALSVELEQIGAVLETAIDLLKTGDYARDFRTDDAV